MVKLNIKTVGRCALGAVVAGCAWHVISGRGSWQAAKTGIAERHAEDKPAWLADYVSAGLWYGCLFSGAAALILLATSSFWLRDQPPVKPAKLSGGEGSAVPRKVFWIVLCGILILSAIPRLPRMTQSFWGDEDWAYRDLIGGSFRENPDDGSLKFKRHSWKVSAFWDKGTNNQYTYTLTARACHDGWKRITGAPPEAFTEAVLRVPSLLAGFASILMGAILLRRLGFSRAALFLAALLAVHPWHIRYSCEARGYTMLIFFLLAGIYFLLAALEDGRWRTWLLFGLCQFLTLYTWKAAIHPIAALNLCAFTLLLMHRRSELHQFGRWLVVNVLGLMMFVPLFAPAIPQIRRKLAASSQAKGEMGLDWIQNVFAQLLSGTDLVSVSSLALWVVAPVALCFLVLGRMRLGRAGTWLLVAAPIYGCVLAFVHFSLTGNELLHWYLFYSLPFLLIPVAVGLEFVGRRFGNLFWSPAAAFLVLYLAANFGVLKSRMFRPIQPSREAAAVTRNDAEGRLHMAPSDIVTVGMFRASQSYDPRMRQGRNLRTGEALMAVVEECRATGKRLRVSAAHLGFARETHADFFELLDDPEFFRQSGSFPAAEAYLDIETYELLPASPTAEPGSG